MSLASWKGQPLVSRVGTGTKDPSTAWSKTTVKLQKPAVTKAIEEALIVQDYDPNQSIDHHNSTEAQVTIGEQNGRSDPAIANF